ncbi:MAG: ATP-binding protein [bacterium]
MKLRPSPLLLRLRALTRSLRFKASAGIVAFLCLTGAGLSALFLGTWEQHDRAAARRDALSITAALADVVAPDAARGDVARVRRILLAHLSHDPTMLYVAVRGASGEILRIDDPCPEALRRSLASWPAHASGDTRVRTRSSPVGPVLDVVVPLVGGADGSGRETGQLRVGFALRSRASQSAELRWRIAAITLAMLVLGTAGAMFLIGRMLGPLPELARATARVAEGDFDVRMSVDAEDELGVLARSFNQMTERLLWWQERQRSWSRELEQRVDEKTKEIAETREHLANIVENVGASILVADLDGTVISANTHTMHIFGMKPEFAVGRRLEEFGGDAAQPAESLLPHLTSGGSKITEFRLNREGGRTRDLLVVHTLLRDSGGRAAGFLQITKDVTELKEMERRLVQSERLSAMGEMAGEIGHELNNYLMAIGGRAELIVAALDEAPDGRRIAKIRRSAEIIAEQVGEMRRLTDGLLDASRKETSPTDVDLGELVERTIEFVRPQNRFDGISIESIRSAEDLHVFADPQQLRQVVLNLLTNAAESTRERLDKGGAIRVETFREQGALGVRVSDDGVGIESALQQRIFEPHFTTKPKGHGFGLAVCHRVVANHGGSIRVDSRRGQGATFTVRLPIPADPHPPASGGPEPARPASSLPPSRANPSPSIRFSRP